MKTKHHQVDFCVVGGGLAGMCAAIAAARHGLKVALMHDRPVLGGNASSEIRMWIGGCHGEENKETGILEEFLLENQYRNNPPVFSIWDSVLYEAVRFQHNLTLILNCSCFEATMAGDQLRAVTGWQLTTETRHTVAAELFADCSGDSVLAPLSGADYRIGREAAGEFNEDIEPPEADRKTMGMTCLIQGRETDRPQKFIPPKWASKFLSDDDLPARDHTLRTNFWWMELGGEQDSIHDTEELRDELLKIAFGVWDHIKNHGDHGAENWILDWVGFLPGKRESRRYVGPYLMTQGDVRSGGRFGDLIAYGGWPMDDHPPAGFRNRGWATIFHPAPTPFGIPYRCLYSRNVKNLFCAGRNISVTHAAMSSTRVMATCAILGQAAGTAAALAGAKGLLPHGIYEHEIRRLQQMLMADDCYLPWLRRDIPELSRTARLTASAGDPEPLRNGIDRPLGQDDNGWSGRTGTDWVEYRFDRPQRLSATRIVFDSDLRHRGLNMPCRFDLNPPPVVVPATMTRAFRIEALTDDGSWRMVTRENNNYQRLLRLPLDVETVAVRLLPEQTWGAPIAHLFAWEVK